MCFPFSECVQLYVHYSSTPLLRWTVLFYDCDVIRFGRNMRHVNFYVTTRIVLSNFHALYNLFAFQEFYMQESANYLESQNYFPSRRNRRVSSSRNLKCVIFCIQWGQVGFREKVLGNVPKQFSFLSRYFIKPKLICHI